MQFPYHFITYSAYKLYLHFHLSEIFLSPIQNNLYCVAYPLNILTEFPSKPRILHLTYLYWTKYKHPRNLP